MKKLLLSVLAVASFSLASNAQSCTPGANFADSVYGVWPDTTTNFPPATQNVFYSTDLNFKVPDTVTAALDPSGQAVGSQIQSFKVTSVTGLPTGFNYACNVSSCQYNGGANGCANIYGTTTDPAGTYQLTINIDATINLVLFPGPPPVTVPTTQSTSFDGYRIVVGAAGIVEQLISPITVSPNPANDVINIEGITTSTKANTVSIVNVEGKVIATKEVGSNLNISFDLSGVKSGIYFVKVSHASGVETVKFIKE